MGTIYTVTTQQPQVYVDSSGQVVNGFLVRVALHEFNEVFEFNLPELKPEVIDQRVREFLEVRHKITQLGG